MSAAHEKFVRAHAHLALIQAANSAPLPQSHPPQSETAHPLSLASLLGRWVELEGNASLTAAAHWMQQAQQESHYVLWLGAREATVFAPDLHKNAIDLTRVVFVFLPHARAMAAAADELLRSGAFSLCIFDLVSLESREQHNMPAAMETRLLGLAQKHQVALLRLSRDVQQTTMHNASLVSLRVECSRAGENRTSLLWHIEKDKVRGPGAFYHQPLTLVEGLLQIDAASVPDE